MIKERTLVEWSLTLFCISDNVNLERLYCDLHCWHKANSVNKHCYKTCVPQVKKAGPSLTLPLELARLPKGLRLFYLTSNMVYLSINYEILCCIFDITLILMKSELFGHGGCFVGINNIENWRSKQWKSRVLSFFCLKLFNSFNWLKIWYWSKIWVQKKGLYLRKRIVPRNPPKVVYFSAK